MLVDQGERRKEIALYLFARSLQLNVHISLAAFR